MRFSYVIACLALLVSACGPPDRRNTEHLIKIRIQNDYVAPYQAGDLDRWLTVFSDDIVTLYPQQAPIAGKRALQAFAAEELAQHQPEELALTIDEIRVGEGWAWVRGQYRTIETATGEPEATEATSTEGTFVQFWEHQKGSEWRISLDIKTALRPPTKHDVTDLSAHDS